MSKISILSSMMGLYIAVSHLGITETSPKCATLEFKICNTGVLVSYTMFFFRAVKRHFLLYVNILWESLWRQVVTEKSEKGELILINLIVTKFPLIVLYFALNLLLQDVGFKKQNCQGLYIVVSFLKEKYK